jgi:hypothetical protein
MTNENIQEVLEARREHFESKRERRVDRFEQAAENAAKRSDQFYERSNQGLPEFGQPILVGHHSEKRHRRALEKSWNNMGKSVQESKKAEYYADKAEAARSNTSISSDDPDALTKLKQKLEGLEADQAHYKLVNKVVRSAKFKKLTDDMEKIKFVATSLECSDLQAAQHIRGHGLEFQGAGYPTWKLSNNNANINRIKQRIKELETSLAAIADEGEAKEIRVEELGVTVFHNHVENRYQLDFDKRLSREAWECVARTYSFRKTREGIFQRQLNTLSTSYMLEKGDQPYSFYRSLKALADADNLFA